MKRIRILFFLTIIFLPHASLHGQKYYDKKNGKYSEVVNGCTEEGKLKNHYRTGKWITYYSMTRAKGPLKSYVNYASGMKDGDYAFYDPKGNLSETGMYTMGKKNGKWINYNEDASIRSFVNYKNDSLDGEEVGYYPNGKMCVVYNWDNGQMTFHKMFYDNGNTLSVDYYKNGKKEGRCWNNVNEGDRDSADFSYCDFTNGIKNGEQREFTRLAVMTVQHWKNDTLDGPYSYSNNVFSRESEKGNYSMGMKTGLWEHTYSGGQVLRSWYSIHPSVVSNPEQIADSTYLISKNGKVQVITRTLNPELKKVMVVNLDTAGNKMSSGLKIANVADSTWTYYFPNGKVSAREQYHESLANGNYSVYYPNGKRMFIAHCTKGKVDSLGVAYDQKGKPLGAGSPLYDSLLRPWFAPFTDVTCDALNPAPPPDSASIDIQDEKMIYTYAEVMPEFPGGSTELSKYINKNVKYPVAAIDEGIQGKVWIRFVVEKDGSITNVQVVKGTNPMLDKEALRVISQMPNWKPGRMNGKPVRVQCTQPINFRLQ
ncbi:MAG TPA: TonB family protein [Bacteroidia bacterium]|jgi:TonB family protein|nr:TonB family protein [Bacteroidia bacterium]